MVIVLNSTAKRFAFAFVPEQYNIFYFPNNMIHKQILSEIFILYISYNIKIIFNNNIYFKMH